MRLRRAVFWNLLEAIGTYIVSAFWCKHWLTVLSDVFNRRGKELSGDLDVVVTHPDEGQAANLLSRIVDYLKLKGGQCLQRISLLRVCIGLDMG